MELRQQGSTYHQILDGLPVAIYTTDRHGTITYYNRAAADLAGTEPKVGKDNGASRSSCSLPTARNCRMTSARWPSRSRKTGRSATRKP
ncbi:PAS domain-containing protein [Mesorhizobium kowhaii]|uniref:PAS domain-containing protein n=1 Tax=Mesorhizobium kowhaii TaxID=1300272 RepID=UPI001FDF4452|nr:PAS domain-containing protein [Mesorhizobium kowhaii]